MNSLFSSFNDYLPFHAARRGDKPMMKDDRKDLSFAEVHEHVERIAAALQRDGLKKGDRIAILAKNSVDNLSVFMGCARAGVIPVGVNYRLAPGEVAYIAADAGVKKLFLDAEFAPLCEGCGELPRVMLDGDGDGPSLATWLEGAGVAKPVVIDGDDILFHMYTSGTTGHPKGVLISHRNVLLNTYQAPMSTGIWPCEEDRSLVIAPTFHAVGLVGAMLGVVYGSSMMILRDYDPVGMIDTLANERITTVAVIPVMLQFSLAMVPDMSGYDFSALKTINYGGSPISESLLRQCIEVFDCDFVQGYGQTEATMALTFLTAGDHRRALEGHPGLLRSCGRAVFGTELKIVNTEGQECAAGEVGEVLARGPQIMQGYWQRPDATAETIVDGWLHTGDAGIFDEEGYLYIQDRVKDMIISGGENIYPAEIENLLMSHPDIADVAVIGRADERWGEVPMAVVVKGGERLPSVDELVEFCHGRIANFKIPKHIHEVPALPRNPSGKILKKDLRAQLATVDHSETAQA